MRPAPDDNRHPSVSAKPRMCTATRTGTSTSKGTTSSRRWKGSLLPPSSPTSTKFDFDSGDYNFGFTVELAGLVRHHALSDWLHTLVDDVTFNSVPIAPTRRAETFCSVSRTARTGSASTCTRRTSPRGRLGGIQPSFRVDAVGVGDPRSHCGNPDHGHRRRPVDGETGFAQRAAARHCRLLACAPGLSGGVVRWRPCGGARGA